MSDPRGQSSGCLSGLADCRTSNCIYCPDPSRQQSKSQSDVLPQPLPVEEGESKDPLAALNKSVPNCHIKKSTGGIVG